MVSKGEFKMTIEDEIIYVKADIEASEDELKESQNKEKQDYIESGKRLLGYLEELKTFRDQRQSGDLSDGFHTFNDLYYQRMILFATLVMTYKDKAWKSYAHEDGELCFGGGWFIVGIDTPEGSYTYHYKNEYWDMFDCKELKIGKHWDGHTDKDVTRMLSLVK